MSFIPVLELQCHKCSGQRFAVAKDIDERWLLRCTVCGRITDMPSTDGTAHIIWDGDPNTNPES